MFKGKLKLIVFLVFSVLLISFTYYGYQICYTPNILVGKESRVIVIPDSADFKKVQEILHEGDYVQDLISFSFLSKLMDYDKAVKAGRYTLQANMTNLEAIRYLRLGLQEPVNITFNNVRLIPDLSGKITKNLEITPEQFEAGLVQFAMTNTYGFNKDNVLCMFIPNTYQVYYNSSPEQLIEKMHAEYEKFWNAERKDKAAALKLTPVEVSILASIVQAENTRGDEARIIAGLYINRLKQGIPLQADPTLVFASGDFSLKRVLNVHKQTDSPYNTYKNAGLPPGPINMPGINAIDGVLNYEKHDYLYMCAKEDFSGRHNFASTLAEHNKNAQRYQAALTREQKIGAALRAKQAAQKK
jgi:UPF0755 protein